MTKNNFIYNLFDTKLKLTKIVRGAKLEQKKYSNVDFKHQSV